ncbi:hydroxypyruvate isomerase family protein [Lacihabitans lacunae]|uniref:Hydroxypyruvate isomerase family protein n=1 Tax=Lacihabitans lacunae TaxID=1028214 RepID=A0ABV7YXM6_9BACT
METSRRNAIKKLVTAAAIGSLSETASAATPHKGFLPNGNISQSVCRWCYESTPYEDFLKEIKNIGYTAVDLVDVKDFPLIKKHGLTCSMVSISSSEWGITKGWNKVENHAGLIKWYTYLIDQAALAGYKNVICFSGNRDESMNDDEGLENCIEGLSKILAYATKKKVTLVMELLNSKVNHKGYMCDSTDWGTELVRMLDSERFKLLYDIYHMQIMEGDIIRTIEENHMYFGHYHTGGNPGRAEIDETQELNYPAIMKAIAKTGFKGFVGQEFIPKNPDKMGSLKKAFELCDV